VFCKAKEFNPEFWDASIVRILRDAVLFREGVGHDVSGAAWLLKLMSVGSIPLNKYIIWKTWSWMCPRWRESSFLERERPFSHEMDDAQNSTVSQNCQHNGSKNGHTLQTVTQKFSVSAGLPKFCPTVLRKKKNALSCVPIDLSTFFC
jgi:hypothetical protein